ncbi:MAG: hypothetical protein QOD99_1182 [Chthoniobacter sp.]|jgi:hypothetical protein|nr:hypothetical protein [Chthoniobacter sp.]
MLKKQTTETVAAFRAALNSQMKDGKPFNGAKSLTVVRATLDAVKKDDGTKIELNDDQQQIVAAIYNPTVPTEVAVIKKVVADAGGALDATTEALLKSVLNSASVNKQLENASKPDRVRIADLLD